MNRDPKRGMIDESDIKRLSEEQLRKRRGRRVRTLLLESAAADEGIETAALARKSGMTVGFLSYAHENADLADRIQELFNDCRIDLYIDKQDKSLDHKSNEKTVEHIRNKIREAAILIYLATDDSERSQWCSWEIGVADEASEEDNVYIFTVNLGKHKIGGKGFLTVYPEITTDQNDKLILVDRRAAKARYLRINDIDDLLNWTE